MQKVVKIADKFNEWWFKSCTMYAAIKVSEGRFPFVPRVVVVKNIPPRNDMFDYMRQFGMSVLTNLFTMQEIELFKINKNFLFGFPERWMSVQEQWEFIPAMCKHPDSANLITVDIITSSPIIVGELFKENISIISFSDDVSNEIRYSTSGCPL